jgi:hypothetical protein
MTALHEIPSERSGVYRTPAELDPVRRACERARLAWHEIELEAMGEKRTALDALARAFGAPPTFGANWDALADMVQDLSWQSAAGHLLHLKGAGPRIRGDDWATLVEILRDSATYWCTRGQPFIVFVDGAPELPTWN